MAEWKDKAIILRAGHFREADIWLKALLPGHGMQTLFAFGGAKSRRRFCGCLDVLNSISCRVGISSNGEFLSLREAVLLAGPRRLRWDWRAMGVAANCALFAEALPIGPESAPECFALLENMREKLENDGFAQPMLPMFFRLRMASALGFAPNLHSCLKCGAEIGGDVFFMARDGGALCPACRARTGNFGAAGQKLSGASLELMRTVMADMPVAWPDFAHDQVDLRQCGRAIDSFVQYHLGLAWDNGYFRRV